MDRRALGIVLCVILLSLAGGLWYLQAFACTPIRNAPPERGSHGYRLWRGETLVSFAHQSGYVCVPEGWEAVGAVDSANGRARFKEGDTGVILKSSAFGAKTLTFARSSYTVRVLYPASLTGERLAGYEQAIGNAFENIGTLYGDNATNAPRVHTVVITAGLGVSGNERDSVYPDPGPDVSYFILPLNHGRSEELFIHAVAHLYNRFAGAENAYESAQSPIHPEDWQELEAAWTETAYESSNSFRTMRLTYLYDVHKDVQTDTFSPSRGAPFNDPVAFAAMQRSVPTNAQSSFVDTQYGHYVLYPLMMTAIDGLLQKRGAGTDVERLLIELHTGSVSSFFETLRTLLTKDDMAAIASWMNGTTLIPKELIDAGGRLYAR